MAGIIRVAAVRPDGLTLVLASSSPRRLELLRGVGIEPRVLAAEVDEVPRRGESANAVALRLACDKARAVAAVLPMRPALVVAADTVVSRDGDLLGKPASAAENLTMLRSLSDRTHEVITAVCCLRLPENRLVCDSAKTLVTFAELQDEDSRWYVATGEGRDKAGGYAIQGGASLWIQEIHGSPSNVIGLPMELLRRLCRQQGVDLLSFANG